MTDKQIIDCEYLKIDEMRTCKALNISFYSDIICNEGDCIILKLKQQLKAKEQECEDLKIQIKTHNDDMFKNPPEKRFYCKGCTLPYISKKLKQTLTEIKEIAEKQCVCGVDCIDMKQILQKISEVEE